MLCFGVSSGRWAWLIFVVCFNGDLDGFDWLLFWLDWVGVLLLWVVMLVGFAYLGFACVLGCLLAWEFWLVFDCFAILLGGMDWLVIWEFIGC